MPSGRTHDRVTYLLILPSFLLAQWYWNDVSLSLVATAAAAFAGLMFGPDLDIHSTQYARWGPARFIWAPYRFAVTHRSRLSHGLLFGTLFRVVYFVVVIIAISTVVLYAQHDYLYGTQTPWTAEFRRVSDDLVSIWQGTSKTYLRAGFIGLWAGAAAHTVADLIASIGKAIWKAI